MRLLELYYWSTEPDLLPVVRAFALLPSETRARLETFIRSADPNAVRAKLGRDGQIRLTSNRQGEARKAG